MVMRGERHIITLDAIFAEFVGCRGRFVLAASPRPEFSWSARHLVAIGRDLVNPFVR